MRIRRCCGFAFACAVLSCAAPAWAVKVIRINVEPPMEVFARAMREGDLARAAELMNDLLDGDRRDPSIHYNAACLEVRLANHDAAAGHLLNAVKAGFTDFSHMLRDADLAPLRGHATYQAIVRARSIADEILIRRALDDWRGRFDPERYRYSSMPEARVHIAAGLSDLEITSMRTTITRQTAYLESTLFAPLSPASLLIIVPLAEEAGMLLADSHAGGCYQHNLRRLVARDAGPALKHELVHALHHRHMDQRGQEHPIWIQEGLATLFEHCRFTPDGAANLEPNERLNLAKHLARAQSLAPWHEFVALTSAQFNRRAAANYAQAWAMMMFLHDRGKLAAWYAQYVKTHAADPTGLGAVELVVGQPLAEIEAQWKAWLTAQPAVITLERDL